MSCTHEWQPRPDRATRGESRYRCSKCGAWGHVNLKRGGAVREYSKTPLDLLDGDPDAIPRYETALQFGERFFADLDSGERDSATLDDPPECRTRSTDHTGHAPSKEET